MNKKILNHDLQLLVCFPFTFCFKTRPSEINNKCVIIWQEMKSKKSLKSLLFLLTVLILITISFGLLVYKRWIIKTPSTSFHRDWETHKSAFYEFKYPPDWLFNPPVLYNYSSDGNNEGLFKQSAEDRLKIRFDVIHSEKNIPLSQEEWNRWINNHIQNYLVDHLRQNIQNRGTVIIDNIKAIALTSCGDESSAINPEFPCIYEIFIPHEKILVDITVEGDLEHVPNFNPILSTFKFIN